MNINILHTVLIQLSNLCLVTDFKFKSCCEVEKRVSLWLLNLYFSIELPTHVTLESNKPKMRLLDCDEVVN